ncbi:MAG: DUF5687 family protein [Bacteroidales bacterium]|nr:DUF5687 family protein [Bacteroidales bacterium]MCF8345262.1 DUF5687 family protein [Bacteroidales bacterium]MCF8351490.1 DUF5687 family protein [Bacteroidales bacterium]MCF8374715.1 DUF5687 family protein [Bacteroidales bacterium]
MLMLKWFIVQQWKEATRSPMWQKNLILNIIIGFFLLLMILYLLALGLFINLILNEVYPEGEHVKIFNGFLLYYFFVDLLMRFLMQGLPKLSIESYLHLPIKKNRIVHYIVGKTMLGVFNFLPLLVLIPVAVKLVASQAGSAAGWSWMIALLALILANNFLATYLKRQLGSKPLVVAVYGLAIIALFVLDHFNLLLLSGLSSAFFGLFIEHPVYLVIPVLWMIVAYQLHFHFLKKRLYPEEIQVKKDRKLDRISDIRYLRSLGIIGSIIALEMKLYWRNKRTRTIIYMLPVFLLYGLFFYSNPEYKNATGFLIFVGIFMSGGMMLNYANYAFGYESGYFDALLTKSINFRKYIRVKYLIAVMISSICFVLTIPYVFLDSKYLFINFVTYLYNIGILSIILLYMATFNKRRMDLTRGAAFNYQGISGLNWLAMLPTFLMPVLIYWPFSANGLPNTGLMFIGILGLIGLVFNRSLVGLITKNFYAHKYKMADGFRQK